MTGQTSAGHFESAAHTMLEVLDRAGAELSKKVSECIEIIANSSLALQKSLTIQLRQIADKYQSFVDSHGEELERDKDIILHELEHFEAAQLEVIESYVRDFRESASKQAEELIVSMSANVQQFIEEISSSLSDPQDELANNLQEALPEVKTLGQAAQGRLDKTASGSADAVECKMAELENELIESLEIWKEGIDKALQQSVLGLEDKASAFLEKLDAMFSECESDLANRSETGISAVHGAGKSALGAMDHAIDGWESEMAATQDNLCAEIDSCRKESTSSLVEDIDVRLSEFKSQAAQLGDGATQNVRSAHKKGLATLKKLEGDYLRKMANLYSRFDSLITESKRRTLGMPHAGGGSLAEQQERLIVNLSVKGEELTNSMNKLAQQLESDYVRATTGLQEKLESITEGVLDLLHKQTQSLKNESDKSVKAFNREILELESRLPELQEAGKSAAVTVMAYRSALLSLEEE